MSRSLPHRLRPLLAPLILIAALSGPISPSAEAASSCRPGEQAWRIQGKLTCVKKVKGLAYSGDAEGAMLRAWMTRGATSGVKETPIVRGALRRALPQMKRFAVDTAAKLQPSGKADLTDVRRFRREGAGGHGPVIERQELSTGTVPVNAAVTAEARVTLRGFADGTVTKEMEYEFRHPESGQAITWNPILDEAPQRKVGCPDAAGNLEWSTSMAMGGTVTARQGRKVLKAVTEKNTVSTTVRGKVGRDAHLQHVDSTVKLHIEHYERGIQLERTLTAPYGVEREGSAPSVSGTLKATASVRVAGASAAEERLAEKQLATNDAGDPETLKALGELAVLDRDRLVDSESVWYRVPNECATLHIAPGPGATLREGQKLNVESFVTADRGGGVASGAVQVRRVGLGSFAPTRPDFQHGSPAVFRATGTKPNDYKITVEADVIATSTAGRAEGGWFAEADPIDIPQEFTGSVSATTTHPGTEVQWAGDATYTLSSVNQGPDGSINAWYEMSDAALSNSSGTIGVGCGWQGSGSGSYIDSGDLEIRILSGGQIRYAILYDLKAPVHYEPVGCPLQPFDSEIDAYLHTRRPGQSDPAALRTAPSDFHLKESGVSDVQPAGDQTTTTASWDLTPSEGS